MRITSLEGQIELLKKMRAPSGDTGNSGAVDALMDELEKMRKEFQD